MNLKAWGFTEFTSLTLPLQGWSVQNYLHHVFFGMSMVCCEFLSFSKLPKLERGLNRRQRGGLQQNDEIT